eukprot:TRINITY_DN4330_c0_g3_i4.p1 TRINITY_DN4330_c0_g3~~TRINITY_DN4330_c0_g3_i4.p1  ORF type:complete len:334 (-),score=98.66 TRINITY_DN4330_c0_g3_i4:378-1379(-)
MKKDILTEPEAKFYIAELILAVASVHKMNYIHRDLKPDNILIDNHGHLKLSDFGLCKHADLNDKLTLKPNQSEKTVEKENGFQSELKKLQFKRNRKLAFSTVGTPDYIAPEVFSQKGYSELVDWWSVGVILYEMLVGYPPFFSDDPSTTCQKILNWRRHLAIPPEANLSPEATDLIKRLLTDAGERLGLHGIEEIKAHPFFGGVDWRRIREKKAPYIPSIKSEIDTSNFDKYEEEEPWICDPSLNKAKRARKDVQFIGYTFKRDFENERTSLIQALEELEQIRTSRPRIQATSNLDKSAILGHKENISPLSRNEKRESFPLSTQSFFPLLIRG